MTNDERDAKLARCCDQIHALAGRLGVRIAGVACLVEDPEHLSALMLSGDPDTMQRTTVAHAVSEAAEVMLGYANDFWTIPDEKWETMKGKKCSRNVSTFVKH